MFVKDQPFSMLTRRPKHPRWPNILSFIEDFIIYFVINQPVLLV